MNDLRRMVPGRKGVDIGFDCVEAGRRRAARSILRGSACVVGVGDPAWEVRVGGGGLERKGLEIDAVVGTGGPEQDRRRVAEEDPASTANDGAAVGEGLVGEADAWTEVQVIDRSLGSVEAGGQSQGIQHSGLVEALTVPTNTEGDIQTTGCVPVILREGSELEVVGVGGGAAGAVPSIGLDELQRGAVRGASKERLTEYA